MLPYHTNLFYFVLKMFWSIAFSSGIFMLMYILNKFHVGGLFQIVITASLGVMPHILNMVALKANEERKKAWNEKLKLNVKYMVEDLTRENPELGRTVLIMEEDDDATANNLSIVKGNIQYESSVWCISSVYKIKFIVLRYILLSEHPLPLLAFTVNLSTYYLLLIISTYYFMTLPL